MIKQAIILAGGLGTRLRSVVSEVPKCMAPVAGKPFLHYVIAHLSSQGITDFIVSVGYKSESIISFIRKNYGNCSQRMRASLCGTPRATRECRCWMQVER